MPITALMGLIYGISEIGIGLLKRVRGKDDAAKDGGSLRLLWITILSSLVLANVALSLVPQARYPLHTAVVAFGVVIYAAGLLLRWTSILWLGKFFTVQVAIAADHRVIDTGPYRFIRHPSYTGALVAFLGLAICTGNALSVLLMVIPVTWAFMRRIALEEAVLREALGDDYIAYSKRTKRLVPFVY